MLRILLQLQQPFYTARHEEAPLLLEREAFVEHLLRQGTSLGAARIVAWQLLNVIRLLKLTQLRDVWSTKSRQQPRSGHDSSARIQTSDLTSTRGVSSSKLRRSGCALPAYSSCQ